MDETPYYLANIGRVSDAENTLKMIARTNKVSITISIQKFKLLDREDKLKNGVSDLFKMLFTKENKRTSLMFAVIYFFLASGYTNMLYFMPLFLDGYSIIVRYLIIMSQQICAIPGTIVSSYLCNSRFGSRRTLALGIFLSSIFCFLFYLDNQFGTVLTFTSLLILVIMLAYGALYMITPESYSTEIKSTGSGWSNACGRSGGLLTPLITG